MLNIPDLPERGSSQREGVKKEEADRPKVKKYTGHTQRQTTYIYRGNYTGRQVLSWFSTARYFYVEIRQTRKNIQPY